MGEGGKKKVYLAHDAVTSSTRRREALCSKVLANPRYGVTSTTARNHDEKEERKEHEKGADV